MNCPTPRTHSLFPLLLCAATAACTWHAPRPAPQDTAQCRAVRADFALFQRYTELCPQETLATGYGIAPLVSVYEQMAGFQAYLQQADRKTAAQTALPDHTSPTAVRTAFCTGHQADFRRIVSQYIPK